MLLNKTLLITLFSLFICTACVSTHHEEHDAQQVQITNLQAALTRLHQENQQTQTRLVNIDNRLNTWQDKVDQLTKEVQSATSAVASTPVKVVPAKAQPISKLNDKTIFGRTEWVYIAKVKSNYKARIDTGAETSSINATNIEPFERDGKKWVRFNLFEEEDQDPQVLEAEITRSVKILQSSKPGKSTSRPVVKLYVRVADIAHITEFTLTDRSHMEYPILIGRSFLKDVVLVDVSKRYIHPKYKQQDNAGL